MGRPKKVNKKAAGRKLSTGYSLKSPRSRIQYHILANIKNSGKQPSPSSSRSSEDVPQVHVQLGRPPLDSEAGPMSPGSLDARRRFLGRISYKKKRIK